MTLRLLIAVPTYRRPELLTAGLPLVIEQAREVSADPASGVTCDVLVVDNDADGSARDTVAAMAAADVRYVVEPQPGIVAARNRALDEGAEHDLLSFLDDDERPRPDWLASLVRTYLDGRPAAVMGRVISQYDRTAIDPWVASGDLFRRLHWPTGTQIEVAAAGNLLLDLRQVRELGVRFDPRLGMSGGEDSLFSKQLVRRGGRIVFCDESIADDHVASARLTRQWVLRRAVSQGNIKIRIEMMLARTGRERGRARAVGFVRGVARLAGGALRVVQGTLTRSPGTRALGTRTVYRGVGMVHAAVGGRVEEYARD